MVLLPLLIVGFLSLSKSSNALLELSKNQAQNVAADLARLADNTLTEEIKLAEVLTTDHEVVNTLILIKQAGINGATDQINELYRNLGKKFAKMGSRYQGIYVTDSEGNRFTGILDDGTVYKPMNISDREYFKSVKATGKTVIDDVARSAATNNLICTICSPVKAENQEFLGTFALVLKVDFLTELISGRKIGNTGYGYMLDKNGLTIAHPVQDYILKLDQTKLPGMETIVRRMLAGEKGVEEYTFKGIDKIAGFTSLTVAPWHIGATQEAGEFMRAAHSIRDTSLIVIVVSAAITILIVTYFAGLIVKPLKKAIASLKDIAEGEGDLTMRLDAKSKDEIGELGFWFNTFIEKLQGIVKRIAENSKQVNNSSDQLSTIARQLSVGAEDTSQRAATVATASEEMTANLNNVAAAMEESSTNSNMVAAAAEEMTATINQIAENAEHARGISSKAVVQAKDASVKMGELGEAARKISMVTETITEISEQTNLLALNATIEAARAGEAGKGFAVVANEIKDLAKQTAQATMNIKSQIDDVQQTTNSAVMEIDQISKVISGVNDIIATIALAVDEQTAATQEIANNIAQASQGIQEVNENVNQSSTVAFDISQDISKVNLAATEISQNSKEVKASSEDLQRMALELNTIVNSFKV